MLPRTGEWARVWCVSVLLPVICLCCKRVRWRCGAAREVCSYYLRASDVCVCVPRIAVQCKLAHRNAHESIFSPKCSSSPLTGGGSAERDGCYDRTAAAAAAATTAAAKPALPSHLAPPQCADAARVPIVHDASWCREAHSGAAVWRSGGVVRVGVVAEMKVVEVVTVVCWWRGGGGGEG